MTTDDFCVPEVDVFPLDVDMLVTKVYKAAIAGIQQLGKQYNQQPEADGERLIWLFHVRDMKVHAGNMCLVSLISLFDGWLEKKHPCGHRKSRFQELETRLGQGPLKLSELNGIIVARNSIVHHGGKSRFRDPSDDLRTVDDQYLDFEGEAPERVAITEALLTGLTEKIKSQVEFWNAAGRKRS